MLKKSVGFICSESWPHEDLKRCTSDLIEFGGDPTSPTPWPRAIVLGRCACNVTVRYDVDLTADWSLMGTQYRTMKHLHSWTSAVLTLTGAVVVAVFIIAVLYCKVHRLYRTVCWHRTTSYDSQLQYVHFSTPCRHFYFQYSSWACRDSQFCQPFQDVSLLCL